MALTLRLVVAAAPTELDLSWFNLSASAAIGALVDAALAQKLSVVSLHGCQLSAAAAPALARLLGGGAVTELRLFGVGDNEELWADEAGAALLSGALRQNSTLTALQLRHVRLWHIPAAAAELLEALTGHPSLRQLKMSGNYWAFAQHTAAAAAALGALVAADTLTYLDVSYSSLGDVGIALGPLFDALPRITRLRTLYCVFEGYGDDDLSEAFVRNRAAGGACAPINASLRELLLGDDNDKRASVHDAEALVNSRGDA